MIIIMCIVWLENDWMKKEHAAAKKCGQVNLLARR